jgi:hypothetical protein
MLKAALLGACLCACGGSSLVSCDRTKVSDSCVEYTANDSSQPVPAATLDGIKQECTFPPAGTFAVAACPRSGAIGACRHPSSAGTAVATAWAYAPVTVAMVQPGCEADGGVFITP